SSLTKFKGAIAAPPELDTVLSSFLSWTPTPITTVTRLVDTIAPLAALLREEVLESLKANRRNAKATGREENSYPFIGLKRVRSVRRRSRTGCTSSRRRSRADAGR